MLHTKGIVFRTVKFKESSLIAEIYTEDKGLHTFFMNGVFSSKTSRTSALLQVGNILELVAYYSDKRELHRIKEISSDYLFRDIPNQIFKSAIATFIIEFCRHSIKDQSGNSELFQFLKRCLILLDKQEQTDNNFHLKFMLKLSKYLGLQANKNYDTTNNSFDLLNACFVPYSETNIYCLTPKISLHLHQLMCDDADDIQYELRNELLNVLLQYFKIHMDHFGELKSPSVYKSIL